MTAAVYRTSTPSLSLPQTQNTAPVLEHNCLYTHDLRRKAKRWQDGFLRFHTFNKRIMVYDLTRNYIGDTHWTGDVEVADGDEITLDKGGVLVQVAEATGKTETDLTGIRAGKKMHDRGGDASSPATAPRTPIALPRNTAHSHVTKVPTQLKHRSLNALLGASRTPIGKAALPVKSPFEQRHGNTENEEWEGGRPPKRQRTNVSGTRRHADDTPTVPLVGEKPNLPLWARTSDASQKSPSNALPPDQRKPKDGEVVDLVSDSSDTERIEPSFSSEALAPVSSPPRQKTPARAKPLARSSSPASKTQRARHDQDITAQKSTRDSRRGSEVGANQSDKASREADARPMSGARDTRRLSRNLVETNTESNGRTNEKLIQPPTSERPGVSTQGAKLRVAVNQRKKKTLLCQDQLTANLTNAACSNEDDRAHEKARSQLLEERLARIKEKQVKANTRKSNSTPEAGSAADERTPAKEEVRRSEVRLDDTVKEKASDARQALQAAEQRFEAVSGRSVDVLEPVEVTDPNEGQQATSRPNAKEKSASPLKKTIARKKVGVGKRDTRASASACFQKPPRPSPSPSIEASPVPTQEVSPQPALDASQPEPEPFPAPAHDHDETPVTATTAEKPQRIPGAPIRFTAPPIKAPKAAAPRPEPLAEKLPAIPKWAAPRPAPRKALQRAVSLNTSATGTATVMLGRPFQPPKPPAVAVETAVAPPADPWSREAFDLFDWRPPGWDEEVWCLKENK